MTKFTWYKPAYPGVSPENKGWAVGQGAWATQYGRYGGEFGR